MKPKPPVKTMKEAFATSSAIPATTPDPTAGRNPYRAATGMGYFDQLMTGKIAEDERNQKAPKMLPFPLDRSIDQMAVVYQDLMTLGVVLTTAMKDGLISTAEKRMLRQKTKEVKAFMDNLKLMSYEIERMHL